jgi:hypothetical protein
MTSYFIPNFIEKYLIYDILYNDNGELIIITPHKILPPPHIQLYDNDNNNVINFLLIICPHNNSAVYKLKYQYKKNITLIINNEKVNTYVNKYPEFIDEIIMSTVVKNEDNYIKQWIEYHKNLNVNRFIIYDNSIMNTLSKVLEQYINDKTVILIKWTYTFTFQQPQQNHSIYTFNNSKYIGLLDIDEYVNPQNNYTNIDTLFNDLIIKNNIKNISGFVLLNKFFYNPDNKPTDNFNFLKIYNCDRIKLSGNEKIFVIPKNVNTFSVHTVTSGKPIYTIDPTLIYFNHYIFLNKINRGLDRTTLTDDSIINKVSALEILTK